jgi:type IV pilus assembly protein PilF
MDGHLWRRINFYVFDMLIFSAYSRYSLKTIYIFILSVHLFSTGCAGTQDKKQRALAMEDMGRSLVIQGNPREALVYLLKAAELDPDNPDIEHKLARVYEDIGENDLALQRYKKAISLKPNFSEAFNNMGALYSKMKEWDKALECFQEAASDILYTTPHFAYHNMGLVYFYNDDYSRAIENYQKAMILAPSYVNVYYDLASVYIAQNRYEDAIDLYKKASALSPQSRQADLSLAKLYINMGRKQEAVDLLRIIVESSPRSHASKEANELLENLQKNRPK